MKMLDLPQGIKLLRTFKGHQGSVHSVVFEPGGSLLASGSSDQTVKLWDLYSGELLRSLTVHQGPVYSVAFDPTGHVIASGSGDHTVKLWDPHSGLLLRSLIRHDSTVNSVAFDPEGHTIASGSSDGTVKLWDPRGGGPPKTFRGDDPRAYSFRKIYSVSFDPAGRSLAICGGSGNIPVMILWDLQSGTPQVLKGHQDAIFSLSFDSRGRNLASGGADRTVKLWDAYSGKLLRTLEGHTAGIKAVAFFSEEDRDLLVSKGDDHTLRLWRCDTWEPLVTVPEPTNENLMSALAFHPKLPLMATTGSDPDTPEDERCRLIHLWELDLNSLLGKRPWIAVAPQAVHHTTSKIVLVGDHSVGKSGLGFRLVHGSFEEQASTHGQQFWVFPELGKRRADGTECEAILWDLAGQPDYRLVHALFVDDADLALVLFDASDIRDPLHGVGFWLQQLKLDGSRCPVILVGAQSDRGTPTLTETELKAFCKQQGIAALVRTSALTGEGVGELIEQMKILISWDEKPATVTTATFKRIKDYVLELKAVEAGRQAIVSPNELRRHMEATDVDWQFSDNEMMTAVGHLENYGYLKRLHTSNGEERILLAPDLLNNLASSFVLEARRNPKGLGSLEERQLLAGGYAFPELTNLSDADRTILLDSAALLFLEHNVCFRETDPLRIESYLVFPELINLKKPLEENRPTVESVTYTVSGATENVFASLVVLLGYTHTFTRTNQWQNHARYEVGDGLVCGFRQNSERDGELDFVLYFDPTVPKSIRTLFQGLFESFLARRNLTVVRYEPVVCPKCGHELDRGVVRQRSKEGKTFTFCNECSERLVLLLEESIQLTQQEQAKVDTQRRTADERTRFEQAIFRMQAYVTEQKIDPPECFISYAWGDKGHERWVEKSLAKDLQKAGINVMLDRWENARVGASVARFVERIDRSDRVIVVGTPSYRRKYENKDVGTGYVVAAEVDMISKRLLGTEEQKESVLPALVSGEREESLPPLLQGRVYADFRDEQRYFYSTFDLALSLYGIKPNDPVISDLREILISDSIPGVSLDPRLRSQRQ